MQLGFWTGLQQGGMEGAGSRLDLTRKSQHCPQEGKKVRSPCSQSKESRQSTHRLAFPFLPTPENSFNSRPSTELKQVQSLVG